GLPRLDDERSRLVRAYRRVGRYCPQHTGCREIPQGGPPRLYTARFRPELIHFRPATGFRPASGGEVWRTLRASGPRPKLGANRAYTRARLPTSSLRLLGSAGSGQAIRGIRLAILRQPVLQ